MRRRSIALVLAVAAGAGLAIAVGVPAGLVLEVAVAVGVTAFAFRTLSGDRFVPDAFEAALARHARRPHDPHAVLRRKMGAARASAADMHRILRPVLRDAAMIRLQRHGVALDRDDEASARILGDRLWELVRPARARPGADEPAWDDHSIADALDRLEQL